jgi:hypothetical protein
MTNLFFLRSPVWWESSCVKPAAAAAATCRKFALTESGVKRKVYSKAAVWADIHAFKSLIEGLSLI